MENVDGFEPAKVAPMPLTQQINAFGWNFCLLATGTTTWIYCGYI